MKPKILLTNAFGVAAVVAAAFLVGCGQGNSPAPAPHAAAAAQPTNIPGGAQQFVEIIAKGGYTPASATAKAGVPLLLKIKTDGTFDCSASLRIASLNWAQDLGPTTETSIPVPAQAAGSTLTGVCSMGMYHFQITFE